MQEDNRYNFFRHKHEQQRIAVDYEGILRAEPGEENVGFSVTQNVLDSKSGGEVCDCDGRHDRVVEKRAP